MYPPKNLAPVTTLSRLSFFINSSPAFKFDSFTTKILFSGSGKYPKPGPICLIFFSHLDSLSNVPALEESSAYQTCISFSIASKSLFNSIIPKAYRNMESGSPCVTPSLD